MTVDSFISFHAWLFSVFRIDYLTLHWLVEFDTLHSNAFHFAEQDTRSEGDDIPLWILYGFDFGFHSCFPRADIIPLTSNTAFIDVEAEAGKLILA